MCHPGLLAEDSHGSGSDPIRSNRAIGFSTLPMMIL